MKDDLGNRQKSHYEDRFRYLLPRRTYTILRLDGKSFHSYCRGLTKPFDIGFIADLNEAVRLIMPDIMGTKIAFLQSDEVSILLTDFDNLQTDAWFDGSIQKMSSVAASMLTAQFNHLRLKRDPKTKLAYFDARVFVIPNRIEVYNYFLWRNKDCFRNGLNSVARTLFSHKEMMNKSMADVHRALFEKGLNFATDYSEDKKNGRLVIKTSKGWEAIPAWNFLDDKQKLLNLIPSNENEKTND